MRSLSRLVNLAARREVKDDWTGALDRARRLVDAADRVHRMARRGLKSVHIAADGRVIYACARSAKDLAQLTALLGDEFTRALNGSGLVITIITRTAPPPVGALRVRDFARNVECAARRMRAASTALAVGGLVAGSATLAAAETGTAVSPLASLTTEGDWACGIVASERLWTVRVVLRRDGRDVEIIDGDSTENAASITQFIRGAEESSLRADPLALVGPRGERIVAIVRYEDSGDRFDLTIASCPPPAAAPGVSFIAETPFSRAYEEIGVDFISRTEQHGFVAGGVAQIQIEPNTALNLQLALGDISHDPAVGGQVAVQTFRPMGENGEVAAGAFLSAVQSSAPNGDDLTIQRVGAGVSVIGEETQIIVRGGYAQASGYSESEGGFVRVEAGWFPVERLSVDVFAEDDPITGAGAGFGTAARPFSGVYAGLMIDADAAWHEDGEESFRLGLRWAFGAESNERDRRRRRGMTPYMPHEFERLPEADSQTQSYCGDADPACPTSTSAPFHE